MNKNGLVVFYEDLKRCNVNLETIAYLESKRDITVLQILLPLNWTSNLREFWLLGNLVHIILKVISRLWKYHKSTLNQLMWQH